MARQPDTCLAHGLKRLAKVCCCALGGGGGVVQFMRQTRRELAKRHQLVALRFNPRGLTNAISHEGNQPLAKQGHTLEHLREEASAEVCDTSKNHGARRAAVVRQPRVRQKAGNLPRKPSEDDLIRSSPLYLNLSLKNHDEIVQRFAFPAHDLSRLEMHFL